MRPLHPYMWEAVRLAEIFQKPQEMKIPHDSSWGIFSLFAASRRLVSPPAKQDKLHPHPHGWGIRLESDKTAIYRRELEEANKIP